MGWWNNAPAAVVAEAVLNVTQAITLNSTTNAGDVLLGTPRDPIMTTMQLVKIAVILTTCGFVTGKVLTWVSGAFSKYCCRAFRAGSGASGSGSNGVVHTKQVNGVAVPAVVNGSTAKRHRASSRASLDADDAMEGDKLQ